LHNVAAGGDEKLGNVDGLAGLGTVMRLEGSKTALSITPLGSVGS
jgi:hypothetical protein